MAVRPVFVPQKKGDGFVKTYNVEFQWFPGLAKVQKQKNIDSLHEAFAKKKPEKKILEVSSKSKTEIGVSLSAFNLRLGTEKTEKSITVEAAFQGSKVFESDGPYEDLLYVSSIEAKKDVRLKNSGELIRFSFQGQEWPLEPKTLFYDWIYLNALHSDSRLSKEVLKYGAFTDIEFNPKKSINCQARSVALYVSFYHRGILEDALSSDINYKELLCVNNLSGKGCHKQQLLPGC